MAELWHGGYATLRYATLTAALLQLKEQQRRPPTGQSVHSLSISARAARRPEVDVSLQTSGQPREDGEKGLCTGRGEERRGGGRKEWKTATWSLDPLKHP